VITDPVRQFVTGGTTGGTTGGNHIVPGGKIGNPGNGTSIGSIFILIGSVEGGMIVTPAGPLDAPSHSNRVIIEPDDESYSYSILFGIIFKFVRTIPRGVSPAATDMSRY